MLVLSRKKQEKIFIGNNITVTVTDIGSGQVRLGIEAPKEIRILRGEHAEKENNGEIQLPVT